MKKVVLVIGAAMLCVTAIAAAPKQALAGCFCSVSGCGFDPSNTATCRSSGTICVLGNGIRCDPVGAPQAFDGTISQSSTLARAESRPAMLRRRGCDGAVVDRQYATDEARRLRESTRKLVV